MMNSAEGEAAHGTNSATDEGGTGCRIVHLVTTARPRGGHETKAECAELPDKVLRGIEEATASWRDRKYVVRRLHALVARHELGGLVVVIGERKKQPLYVPQPLAVPFEPLELDEAHPGLVALGDAPTTEVGANAPTADAGVTAKRPRPSSWRRLALRLGIPLIFAAQFLFNGIPQMIAQRNLFTFVLWGSMLAVTIIIAAVAWLYSDQWFVIPGGVVVRKSLAGKVGRSVRRHTPGDSILLLCPAGPGWQAELFRDGKRNARKLTALETTALLAAWRSPIPAPQLERLIDLQ